MNVLLIGGTGVLSSAVTKELQIRGINVTMINRGNRTIPNDVTLIKTDNKNYSYIRERLNGLFFDAIIDFICFTDNDIRDSFDLYKDFTKQYFFISSGAVYNTALGGAPFSEGAPKVLPIWSYSVNKWKSECLLVDLASHSDCNYTVIRPGVTYDDSRIPYGVMPPYGYHWSLCARILAHKPIISWKGGAIRSSVMRVEDFAFAMVSLVGNPQAYNQVYNISGNESPSALEIIKEVERCLNEKAIMIDIPSEFYAHEYPSKAGEILGGRSIDSPLDNSKIKSVVSDFCQTIVLAEGIKRTIDAYKSQNYQKGINWAFDATTDRILKKWCKKNKIDYGSFHLGFVDYLGTASWKDRVDYYLNYYEGNIIVSVLSRILSFIKHYC